MKQQNSQQLCEAEQTITTTPQWVKPGVAYIHIPQRNYDGANEFDVEATLERIPNGNFDRQGWRKCRSCRM